MIIWRQYWGKSHVQWFLHLHSDSSRHWGQSEVSGGDIHIPARVIRGMPENARVSFVKGKWHTFLSVKISHHIYTRIRRSSALCLTWCWTYWSLTPLRWPLSTVYTVQGHMLSFVQVQRGSVELDDTVRYLDLLQVYFGSPCKIVRCIHSRQRSPDITGCVTSTALRVTTRGRTWLMRMASGPGNWCTRSSPWRPWLSEMASSFNTQNVYPLLKLDEQYYIKR